MDGIIPIYKARGLTSHDVVFHLRKILHTKRVGHTGTLDPEVDGVLPICVGSATRVAEYITNSGKKYVAEVTLGVQTTTEDQTGDVVCRVDINSGMITDEAIDSALSQLTGDITQIPPMYSAVKVKGRKLYEYARRGEDVKRPSRVVTIHSITRTSDVVYREGTVIFNIEVSCGKGTYIRTLATQIAELLKVPGHMSKLTRTYSGGFSIDETYSLDDLRAMELEEIRSLLLPIEQGLKHLPSIEVSEEIKNKIIVGQKLAQMNPPIVEETGLTYQGKTLATYIPHPSKEGVIKARKVFVTGQND